jgi:hypothetical protein
MRYDFNALDFTVVASQINDVVVSFDVYEIVARGESAAKGVYDVVNWRSKEDYQDTTTDITKARRYLHGDIKWDGCSNWYFDEQDHVMLHFCSLKQIEAVSGVMKECWDIAAGLIANWEGDDKPWA